jgi:uncharacterized membrane protein YkoI
MATRKTPLRARSLLLLAALVSAVGAGAAAAQPRPTLLQADMPVTAFAAQRGGGGISLSQATAMAQSRYQGRVVRAEPVAMGERVVYEIRILGNDGRVRTVRIDAQTGAFL